MLMIKTRNVGCLSLFTVISIRKSLFKCVLHQELGEKFTKTSNFGALRSSLSVYMRYGNYLSLSAVLVL